MVSELQACESVSFQVQVTCMSNTNGRLLSLLFTGLFFLTSEVLAILGPCTMSHGVRMKMCLCPHVVPVNSCPHFRGP